jgi:hypothetical protein
MRFFILLLLASCGAVECDLPEAAECSDEAASTEAVEEVAQTAAPVVHSETARGVGVLAGRCNKETQAKPVSPGKVGTLGDCTDDNSGGGTPVTPKAR